VFVPELSGSLPNPIKAGATPRIVLYRVMMIAGLGLDEAWRGRPPRPGLIQIPLLAWNSCRRPGLSLGPGMCTIACCYGLCIAAAFERFCVSACLHGAQ